MPSAANTAGTAAPPTVTVPAVGPDAAHAITRGSGCRTAKVKVAEPGQDEADDIARVEAIRLEGADLRGAHVDPGLWTAAKLDKTRVELTQAVAYEVLCRQHYRTRTTAARASRAHISPQPLPFG